MQYSNESGSFLQKHKMKIIIVAVIALVAVGAAFLFSGRSYEKAIQQYVTASCEADAKKIIELIPDDMLAYALHESGYDEDELPYFIEEGNRMLEKMLSTVEKGIRYSWGEEYVSDWYMTHEIVECEDIAGDELSELKKRYKAYDINISAAKEVQVELFIKSGDQERSNWIYMPMVKIGQKWYIDILNAGSLF